MNNLLIKKLIKTNNEKYPEVTYSNPLLDKNVIKALARSFVKILTTCKENSNDNSNIRSSLLEHIRKLCVIQPENHVQLDDSFTEHLCNFYEDNIQKTIRASANNIEKKLDSFLIKTYKDLDLNSSVQLSINAEILQSLINLNDHSINRSNIVSNTIYNDVLHWDAKEQCSIILNNIWNNSVHLDLNTLNDLSIKMKPHIENVLLNICIELLNKPENNLLEIFNCNKELIVICNISYKASYCFQTVCSILNYIFIKTHFNRHIENFIKEYVSNVRNNNVNFAILYPHHLIPVISLLDMDFSNISTSLQKSIIHSTLENLKDIHQESETDLIMLLSHFPNWFDLYFCK